MNTSIRNPDAGQTTTGAVGSAPATDNLFSVTEEAELTSTAAATWTQIKDFNGWQHWHPAFAATEITNGHGNAAGVVRVLTTQDGAKFIEELVSHDAGACIYTYRIIESPLPLVDYVSTLEVRQNPVGSTVTWRSQFGVKPGASGEEMQRAIAGVYRAGLDSLASKLK